jgi:putative transposase
MILDLITQARAAGLTTEKACQVLRLSPRTVERWQAVPCALPASVPVAVRTHPYNALTAPEAEAVVALIQSPAHADASCRELALALQQSPIPTYVSHVTVWAYERELHCNGPRGRQVSQGRGRRAPDTDWVKGPNQLWDWDITYLPTAERGRCLYLYSLLDHWSRKNIAWLIRDQLASAEAQSLWDQGLVNEGLLEHSADTWPQSLSDRGPQMRSHSTAVYFRKLGIAQLFSRPRTPNDNPFIESHFATIKTHPIYPGYFVDPAAAELYFREFYVWYNEVHPHTRLQMLTPSQVHAGQGPQLLAERATLKAATLAARRADPAARQFKKEELITHPLPKVSTYPNYSWAGPKTAPAKQATPLD